MSSGTGTSGTGTSGTGTSGTGGAATAWPGAEHAEALAAAVERDLPAWVERSVERASSAAGSRDPSLRAAAAEAGRRARDDVAPRVRALLETDIDAQRTTPLALLREAVRYPTDVLRGAGVPPVERDEYVRETFPDDDYDLTPASFADISPQVGELGIVWGAAKAWAHRQRHAPGGQGRLAGGGDG